MTDNQYMSTSGTPKIIASKVSGYCGYCGTVKIVPAHRADKIQPRAEVVCGHTSD